MITPEQALSHLQAAKTHLATTLAVASEHRSLVAAREQDLTAVDGHLVALDLGQDAPGCKCPTAVPEWRALIAEKNRRREGLLAELERLRAEATEHARSAPAMQHAVELAAARVILAQANAEVMSLTGELQRARQLVARIEGARSFVLGHYRPHEDSSSSTWARLLDDYPTLQAMRELLAIPFSTEEEIQLQAASRARIAAELAKPDPEPPAVAAAAE